MAGQYEATDRICAAMRLAAEAHFGALRKGTDRPYIAHPVMVAAIVWDDGGTEDEVCAAFLHDAVEDGGGKPRLEQIRRRFGDAVADIVEACSDSVREPDEDKAPWKERKLAYIDGIPHKSPGALRVSMADKIANARDIVRDHRDSGGGVWSRFKVSRGEVLWYYRNLVNAFQAVAPGSRLLKELDATVTLMEALRD